MMHAQPVITDTRLEPRSCSQHKANRRRAQGGSTRTNNPSGLQTSLETRVQTLSLALLPVTLLTLLWMVVMGVTGNF
jgi:hypothetical protein